MKRKREFKIIAATCLVLSVAAIAAVLFGSGLRRRASAWLDWGGGTVSGVEEAFGVVDALDGRPNDDQLIAAIQNPDMPGRKLAIEYLGEGGYGDALPVLERIVRDTSEAPHFRVSALESILFIAKWKGQQLAREFGSDGDLHETVRIILEDEDRILKRPSRARKLIRLAK